MRNWKTTFAGIAAILAVVAKALTDPATLGAGDIAAVLAGIGLLTAKDFDVSHTQK